MLHISRGFYGLRLKEKINSTLCFYAAKFLIVFNRTKNIASRSMLIFSRILNMRSQHNSNLDIKKLLSNHA